jgi:hypothetical protein
MERRLEHHRAVGRPRGATPEKLQNLHLDPVGTRARCAALGPVGKNARWGSAHSLGPVNRFAVTGVPEPRHRRIFPTEPKGEEDRAEPHGLKVVFFNFRRPPRTAPARRRLGNA